MTKEEQMLKDMVSERYEAGRRCKEYQDFVTDFPLLKDMYKGILKVDEERKWRSKLFMNMSYATVETVKGMFKDALLRNDPFVMIENFKGEDKEKARKIQHKFDYTENRIGFKQKVIQLLNYVCKYGFAIAKPYWHYEIRRRRRRMAEAGLGGSPQFFEVSENFPVWDDPDFRIVDPRDWVCDPSITATEGLKAAHYCCETMEVDLRHLEDMAEIGIYKNIGEVKEMLKNRKGSEPPYKRDAKRYPKETYDSRRQRLQLTEYWGFVDIQGFPKRAIHIITVVNDKIVVRSEINPYYHSEYQYSIFNINPQEDSLRGFGILKPIKGDQDLINAVVNQRMDNVALMLNGRYLVNRAALINPKQLFNNMPGGHVDTLGDPRSAVQQLQIPDATVGTFQHTLNTIYDNVQKTTGATDYTMGIARGSLNQTATGVTQLALSANRRIDNMVDAFIETGFKDLVRSLMIMPQQFMSYQQEIMTKDKELITLYPEEIMDFDFDIKIKATAVTNKELIANLYIQLLAILTPYAQTQAINIPEVLRLALSNIPHAEKYLDTIIPAAGAPPAIPPAGGASGVASVVQGAPGTPGVASMVEEEV